MSASSRRWWRCRRFDSLTRHALLLLVSAYCVVGDVAAQPFCDCPNDTDGDCRVEQTDLDAVLANWYRTNATRSEGDVTGDGIVNESDLGSVLADWNRVCQVRNQPIARIEGDGEFECQWGRAQIALSAANSTDADGDPLAFEWQCDCPDASFDDPSAIRPTLNIPVTNCDRSCTVTLRVRDGNTPPALTSAALRVVDRQPPLLTLPADVTLECGSSALPADPSLSGRATSSDTCNASPAVAFTDAPATDGTPDVIRTWIARDACGNAVSGVQRLRVRDSTPPMLECSPRVTIDTSQASGVTSAGVTLVTRLTDACDPRPALSDDRPAVFVVGETRVASRAVDASGNVASCVSIVEVRGPDPQAGQQPPAPTPPAPPTDADAHTGQTPPRVFHEDRRTIVSITGLCPLAGLLLAGLFTTGAARGWRRRRPDVDNPANRVLT